MTVELDNVIGIHHGRPYAPPSPEQTEHMLTVFTSDYKQ